ncbi:isocitrate lyase/PEP mutase family protein [Nocardioides sp. CBS4Y-1]|uniref:Isocitrate lyase/PEP mutase family protein n=2 Tax=Nocardioides acrostichi TaxID=2784339 RepID=A0A930UYM5_9ACTN|nr:isocitrate lyase/PEP mutase family protein [Nocardioides acrostichi]
MRARMREIVDSGRTVVVPGGPNALTTRMIEEEGFEASYVTGAGIANTYLGMPDIGLLSLSELAMHVQAISNVVDIPLIVDADTGFGNAMNTWHTVRTLEHAGASAIQIEDQTFPKRCGHFEGKSIVPLEEMLEKVGAAVDARSDPNLLIVARTDARATHGLADAIERGNAFRDAGADIVFVEAPQSQAEIRTIAAEVPGPKVLNLVQGGKTPEPTRAEMQELGFSIALYANLPLIVSIRAVRSALSSLADGSADEAGPFVSWTERQSLVRKDWFDSKSDEYARGPARLLSDEPGLRLGEA